MVSSLIYIKIIASALFVFLSALDNNDVAI